MGEEVRQEPYFCKSIGSHQHARTISNIPFAHPERAGINGHCQYCESRVLGSLQRRFGAFTPSYQIKLIPARALGRLRNFFERRSRNRCQREPDIRFSGGARGRDLSLRV